MMSPAVCGMYAGCSTLDEDWVAPEHDGQICTLLAAPRGGFHPPHHRALLTPPVTEKQWTRLQVRIRTLLINSLYNVPQMGNNILNIQHQNLPTVQSSSSVKGKQLLHHF